MSNSNTHIILNKELRRDIDGIIQRLRSAAGPLPGKALPNCPNCGSNSQVEPITEGQFMRSEGEFFCGCNMPGPRCFTLRSSGERTTAITKLQEAAMWLGMDLKAINDEFGGAENPYPNSKDPNNTVIDKTADGLKL